MWWRWLNLKQKHLALPQSDNSEQFGPVRPYEVDTRPLCQGLPFILTDSAHPRHVLKSGSHFLVLDQSGFIPACNSLGYGYYRYDTRHLSQWELHVNGTPLSLLSNDTSFGYRGNFLYTNSFSEGIPQQKLIMERQIVLADSLFEKLVIQNFHSETVSLDFNWHFQSDFADMFEVRGVNREQRGERMIPAASKSGTGIFLAYQGIDGMLLETIVSIPDLQNASIEDGKISFKLELPAKQTRQFELTVQTRWNHNIVAFGDRSPDYNSAKKDADKTFLEWRTLGTSISTDNEILDLTIERCLRDIYILRQPTPKGQGLSAGIPWYCAVFGRDTAITCMQLLPFHTDVVREGIEILANYQGTGRDKFRAEHPGKIMHELRLGELARTSSIPHTPYYGSIDATPLWLMLIGEYFNWTGDLSLIERLWPNIKLAVSYLEKSLKHDYLWYRRESPQGLENQGWKDSGDSVVHKDGSLATPPIALCEVQAYTYRALKDVANLATLMKQNSFSKKLDDLAEKLKADFNRDFWMEEEQFVALALDKHKKQVQSAASNAGHCLWTDILPQERAQQVADRLMSKSFETGWGIRTLSKETIAYNPISYHNGSIWPHDNAIIAEGLRRIDRIDDASEIMRGLMAIAQTQNLFRLPELLCGFDNKESERPIDYPVSCSPQAWAAGSIFQLIKVFANFKPDAHNNLLYISRPKLPNWLGELTFRRLRIKDSELDLSFAQDNGTTYCKVLRKTGNVKVIIES